MHYPKMFLAQRNIKSPKIDDVRGAVLNEMRDLNIRGKIKPGMRIAITAGSRGIANIALILSTMVAELMHYGAKPFIVPSMGSHGGATPAGQAGILKVLGITEDSMGCSIKSQMDVVELTRTPEGFPVYLDKEAVAADGIVVVNRVKPHTEYSGDIESGLMKMMTIGLGKHKGALSAHSYAVQYGYQKVITSIGREILKKAPILFGLALVENGHDETARITALPPDLFEVTERRLLQEAKNYLARLPFDKLDILIVEEMGKEISGTGIDTNVIGRVMFVGSPEPLAPRITRIVVLDLTEESQGSATGVGLADFVTRRLVNKINPQVTYINCFTAMTPEKARIPATGETDREAIEWAFQTIGAVDPRQARVVKIKNTLHLDEIHVSESLFPELGMNAEWSLKGTGRELSFDPMGNLCSR